MNFYENKNCECDLPLLCSSSFVFQGVCFNFTHGKRFLCIHMNSYMTFLYGLFCPFGSRDWSMFIDNGNLSSIGLRTELRNWSMILTTGFVDDIEAANHLIIVP
jgi:hypothetical protein